MKKTFRLFSVILVVVVSLGMTACHSNSHKTTSKTSSKTHMTTRSKSSTKKSSSQTSKQEQKGSSATTSSSSQEKKNGDSQQKQGEKSAANSSFNFDALTQGDYSSIAGTWSDASGRVIVISPQGRISVLGTTGSITVSRDGKGEALMSVTYDDGTSFGILMYGAGQSIPDRHFQIGQADPSDTSKDRLVTAYSDILDQGGSDQFRNQVLYKTSNDYSSLAQ